ncbi:hypothetical protein L9F63_001934, partial [Diploptera punctata]
VNFECKISLHNKEASKIHLSNTLQHLTDSMCKAYIGKEDADMNQADGIYFCNLCSAPLGNSSNAMDHKQGKNHMKKVAEKQIKSFSQQFLVLQYSIESSK